MEISNVFNPENLANSGVEINNEVLKTTLQLAKTEDFVASLNSVTKEIRKLCRATFCCILLVDEVKEEINPIAEDRDLNSDRLPMKSYMDEDFYSAVRLWDDTIGDSNCLIINDGKGREFIKEKNPLWYESLQKNKLKSLVLFRLKSGKNQIGYMWVSNFKTDDTTKIKEALEITTFILGFEIGNHLLVNQLTKLSSIDVLTGLYNRNRMNSYMTEIAETKEPIGVIFLDINGLKKVNDTEGHLAGDNLIKRAANVLKNVYSKEYIFRAGGDEFVVILKNIDETHILKSFEILEEKAKKNNVSFAYGYSVAYDSKDIDKVLIEADANMYENKRKFDDSLK